ncbi:hypothetical protein C6499_10230 [Candidatus Poribacteria bacterium]|nr:MAG: hypothetical protein C6499_10230 [Candidatus Poribacteria bacterium]
MTVKIGCIVEGESEVATVPLLIRRIAANLYPELPIVVPPPIRRPRNKIVKENELERAVEFVAQQIGGQGAIFIILDSEKDCPAELGPALLHRASQVRSDLPIAVVFAKHEFEAWFLAAAESIRGRRGLKNDLNAPDNPEAIRGAKEWLSQRMEASRTYRETQDQPALAALFDIEQARQADSFDKCYREIVRLLEELRKANNQTSEQT